MNNPTDTNWRKALREEPALNDALVDPIIQQVMARDGVTLADISGLVAVFQSRESRTPPVSEAA